MVLKILILFVMISAIAMAMGYVPFAGAANGPGAPAAAPVSWKAPVAMMMSRAHALSAAQQMVAIPGAAKLTQLLGCNMVAARPSDLTPSSAPAFGSSRCFDGAVNNVLGTDLGAYGVKLSLNRITVGLPASAGTLAHNLELSYGTRQHVMLMFHHSL